MVKAKRAFYSSLVLLVLTASTAGISPSFASSTSISINTISDSETTYNSPFNFSCSTNALFNPITLNGSGTGSTGNGTGSGNIQQYHVQIDWGDGTVQNAVTSTFNPSSGKGSFEYTFSGSHSYTSTSNFTIHARLYHQTPPGTDNQADTSVTVTLCVHVPPPAKGSIKVVKTIVGGDATTTDFAYHVGTTTVLSGQANDFLPGTYSVGESGGGSAGYSLSYGGDCAAGQMTIATGTYQCNLTNTFNVATGTLIVKKVLVNDNGGELGFSDFSFSVDGGIPTTFDPSGINDMTVSSGTHSIAETLVPGYATTYDNCDSIQVPGNGQATCTITNDDIAAQLTVTKHVINDDGTASSSAPDFTMSVGTSSFPGNESGTIVTLDADTYTVSESGPDGYNQSFSGNCNASGTVALGIGDVATCTVINNDKPFVPPPPTPTSTIIVVKNVINDNGGTLDASAFTMHLTATNATLTDFPGNASGTHVTVQPGDYGVNESSNPAYEAGFSNDCNGTIAAGEVKTCTITNNDIKPKLIVTKNVINDDGGTGVAGGFTINVSGTNVSQASFPGNASGTTITLDAGSYGVSEATSSLYAVSFGDNCSGTIAIGETKACTVTNNDIFQIVIPPSADISINKTVDNATPNEGDTINYTLTVTALGPSTSTGVTANDLLPAGITFVNATASQGTYNDVTGVWTIGDLSAGATSTLEIAATVNSGTADQGITNSSTVSESDSVTDPSSSNNGSSVDVTVQPNNTGNATTTADLVVQKTVDNPNPNEGTTIDYTITVTNLGPGTALGAMVHDQLPPGLVFLSSSSSVGLYSTSTGDWTIGDLTASSTATLVITVMVNQNTAGQTITNIATASESASSTDPDSGNSTAQAPVGVITPGTTGGGGGGGGGGFPNGGGGIGAVPNSLIFGGGSGGGVVSGASTGQVLGEVVSCTSYLNGYLRRGKKNDPNEVKKLQTFLNADANGSLPITGFFGNLTFKAVQNFQLKYQDEILAPWVPYGLINKSTPTGYVYKTTKRWINLIACPTLGILMPQLP